MGGMGTATPASAGVLISQGTLSKTTLLARVNAITRRDLTEMDDELLEALREHSENTFELKTSVSGTLVSSTNTISFPSDFIRNGIIEFYLDDIRVSPITWSEYLDNRVEGIAEGVEDYFYVRPEPNVDKAYTLYYYCYNPNSVDSIYFRNIWQQALVYLCCKKVYESFELWDAADKMEGKYWKEVKKYRVLPPMITNTNRSGRHR